MAAKKKKTTAPSRKPTTKSSIPVKTTTKKVPAKVYPIEPAYTTPVENHSLQTESSKKGFRIKRVYVFTVVAIVVIIMLLYIFRSQFIVATVNGQPISRSAYNTELENEAGRKSMNALVTKMLIVQEANKEHVTVSDKEVNDQINLIQASLAKQGQSLTTALATQGLTMEQLKDQIKTEKLIEKMLGKKIQVTDKEISDYIQTTQQAADSSGNVSPTPQLSRDAVKQQLQQQKLSTQVTPWLQSLQQKAKISYFITQ